MRIIVRALLPLGEGTVLDPFMGSSSNIAAAEAIGYRSVGIEIDQHCFRLAETAIPRLAALYPTFEGDRLEFDSSDYPQGETEAIGLAVATHADVLLMDEKRGREAARRNGLAVGGLLLCEAVTTTGLR